MAISLYFLDVQLPSGDFFQVLHMKGKSILEAVVFLHGLGENKTGLNYIFHTLATETAAQGYDAFCFDLSGSGENCGALSFNLWIEQLRSLAPFLSKYRKIHVVSRGISALLVPYYPFNGMIMALGPTIPSVFKRTIKHVRYEAVSEQIFFPLQDNQSNEETLFWHNLGAEAGCIGGLKIPRSFFNELTDSFFLYPLSWKIYFGEYLEEAKEYSNAVFLKDSHPLFLFQKDRLWLKKELITNLE